MLPRAPTSKRVPPLRKFTDVRPSLVVAAVDAADSDVEASSIGPRVRAVMPVASAEKSVSSPLASASAPMRRAGSALGAKQRSLARAVAVSASTSTLANDCAEPSAGATSAAIANSLTLVASDAATSEAPRRQRVSAASERADSERTAHPDR